MLHVVKPSRGAAKRYCLGKGVWQSWHPDCVDAYVRHGLGPADVDSDADGDEYAGEVRLRCDPEVEAEIYRSSSDLWAHLAAAPGAPKGLKWFDVFAGENSVHMRGFAPSSEEFYAALAAAAHPDYGLRVTTVEGTTHFLVMERPERVAQEVQDALAPFLSDK